MLAANVRPALRRQGNRITKLQNIFKCKIEIDSSKYVRLGVNRLNIERLFELIKVAELRGVDEILYQLPVGNKPVAFKISKDTVLFLMLVAVSVDIEDCPNIA